MTIDPTAGMTEAQLAEHYRAHRDDTEEWDAPEPVTRPGRLDVTISVRFTADEIAAVRERASEAGMKPTAFIRQAALDVDAPMNRGLLAKTFDRLRSDVEQLASVISVERGQQSTPARARSRTAVRPSPTVSRSGTGRTASKPARRGTAAADRTPRKPAAQSSPRRQNNRTEKPK